MEPLFDPTSTKFETKSHLSMKDVWVPTQIRWNQANWVLDTQRSFNEHSQILQYGSFAAVLFYNNQSTSTSVALRICKNNFMNVRSREKQYWIKSLSSLECPDKDTFSLPIASQEYNSFLYTLYESFSLDLFDSIKFVNDVWIKGSICRWRHRKSFVIYQIERAVRQVHHLNHIFADLKLENILIAFQNDEWRIRLCDFDSMVPNHYLCKDNDELMLGFSEDCICPKRQEMKNQLHWDRKDDYWALGLVILSILCEKPVNSKDITSKNDVFQLLKKHKDLWCPISSSYHPFADSIEDPFNVSLMKQNGISNEIIQLTLVEKMADSLAGAGCLLDLQRERRCLVYHYIGKEITSSCPDVSSKPPEIQVVPNQEKEQNLSVSECSLLSCLSSSSSSSLSCSAAIESLSLFQIEPMPLPQKEKEKEKEKEKGIPAPIPNKKKTNKRTQATTNQKNKRTKFKLIKKLSDQVSLVRPSSLSEEEEGEFPENCFEEAESLFS